MHAMSPRRWTIQLKKQACAAMIYYQDGQEAVPSKTTVSDLRISCIQDKPEEHWGVQIIERSPRSCGCCEYVVLTFTRNKALDIFDTDYDYYINGNVPMTFIE